MKMSETTTYCNPGNNWASCWAQRYNCAPELIEETMTDAKEARLGHNAIKYFIDAMKAMGYKSAAYCDSCGSKYNG